MEKRAAIRPLFIIEAAFGTTGGVREIRL